MFGITVADAVLVGTLLISLLAAWRGGKDGSAAARAKPQPSAEYAIMGATMVDTDTFRDVAVALREVVSAIREHLAYERANDSDRMTELLSEIARKLDPPAPPPHRRHPRNRGGA